MLDTLKHTITRPVSGNAQATAAEKRFGIASTMPTQMEKRDVSTAFERSGWAFI